MLLDIGTVLNKFNDITDERDHAVKEYGIRFITREGKVRYMRSRKGVREITLQQQLQKPLQVRGKITYNLQRAGNMQIHDLDLDKPRTVKPSMIFAFRDFQHTEFSNVRH